MVYTMQIKVAAIIVIGFVIWFIVIKGIINEKKASKKAFLDAVFRFALEENAKQIKDICRDDSFFQMTNDGDSHCDLQGDIEYIDYMGQNKQPYMEIMTYD